MAGERLGQELDATRAALAQLQAGLEGLQRIAALPGIAGDMARRGLFCLENPRPPYVRSRRRAP